MGGSEAGAPLLESARALGRLLARRGWIVLTGGRPAGVMEAAARGAKEVEGSLTVGILPDERPPSAAIDLPIRTDLGQGRNNVNVLTSQVVIAIGVEDAGTASEVALAIRAGKPVILLQASPEALAFFGALKGAHIHRADTPEAAVEIAATLLPGR